MIWLVVLMSCITLTHRLYQRYQRSRVWSLIASAPSVGIIDVNDGIIRRRLWRAVAGSISNLQWVEGKLPRVPSLPPSPIVAEQWGLAPDCTCAALIGVRAIGLNFADVFAVQGLYSATPKGVFTPGLEFAGDIIDVHHNCRGNGGTGGNGRNGKCNGQSYRRGDRIMGVTRFGAYTTHLYADVRCIRPLPHNWKYEHGAATPAQGVTAWYGLHELGNLPRVAAPPTDTNTAPFSAASSPSPSTSSSLSSSQSSMQSSRTVLVHSAAGGVGLFCLSIIRASGHRAIATVSSATKAEWLRQQCPWLPAEAIIVRTNSSSWPSQLDTALQAIGSKGLDITMDSLLGDTFHATLSRVSSMGRVIVLGAAAMTTHTDAPNWLPLIWSYLRRPTVDPLDLISQNKSIMAFNLIWLWQHLDFVGRMLDSLLALRVPIGSNTIHDGESFSSTSLSLSLPSPVVGHTFPLEEAPRALRLFQSGRTVGKVVLIVTPPSSPASTSMTA